MWPYPTPENHDSDKLELTTKLTLEIYFYKSYSFSRKIVLEMIVLDSPNAFYLKPNSFGGTMLHTFEGHVHVLACIKTI